MDTTIKIVGAVVVAGVLSVGVAALYSFFVMLLWNGVIPAIFGLPTITWIQAFGLSVLIGLLKGVNTSSSK
jgi:hypothetical protein